MSQWVTADTSRKSRSHGGPRVPWIALVVVFFLHCPLSTFLDWVGYDFRCFKGWFSEDARTVYMSIGFGLLFVRLEQSPRPLKLSLTIVSRWPMKGRVG